MSGAANLYLGEPKANDDGYGDAGTILSGIVGKASLEAPSMDIIDMGNPDNSYLMHKLDGDMCSMMSQCAAIAGLQLNATINVPCGVQMPQNSPPLGSDEATLVWEWIAQGANNN